MSRPPGPGNRGVIAASKSDALVVFGVTGDLAHKLIFPALYAMVKSGQLTVPIIGVNHKPVRPYEKHTWGPKEAELFVASGDRWRNPAAAGTPE